MKQYVVKVTAGPYPQTEVIEFKGMDNLRDVIGGWLEFVKVPDGPLLICDEEGLLKEDMEPNAIGSVLYMAMGAQTPIMGTVVIAEYDRNREPRWLTLLEAKEMAAAVSSLAENVYVVRDHGEECECDGGDE